MVGETKWIEQAGATCYLKVTCYWEYNFLCPFSRSFVLILGSTRELIYRLQKQRSVEVGSSWKQFTRTENTMTLEYAYKVECGENYYGPGCVNYCRPRDDSFGHYVCDEYGQKVCMQGWKGDYCDQGTHKLMTSATLSNDKIHTMYWQKPSDTAAHTSWPKNLSPSPGDLLPTNWQISKPLDV